MRIGNSEESSDLGPGGVVDTGHGLVVGVEQVVFELSSCSFVGDAGDELETK